MKSQPPSPWTPAAVEERLIRHYGIMGTAHPLAGERDHNFHILSPRGEFVFKLSPRGEDTAELDLRIHALIHLESRDPGLSLPRVVPGKNAQHIAFVDHPEGGQTPAHLLTWVPGHLMAEFRPHSPGLASRLGAFLARMDLCLKDFSHAADRRELEWDLRRTPELSAHLDCIEDPELRDKVAAVMVLARDEVLPGLTDSPIQVIHNDANDHNVVIRLNDPWTPEMAGLVDFGDLVRTYRVCEPAVAAAYACLYSGDPVATIADLTRGYHEVSPLEEKEIDRIFDLARLRMVSSIVLAARRRRDEPDNTYHQISQAAVIRSFSMLTETEPRTARARVRRACGLAATPAAPLIHRWLQTHRHEFAPVMAGLDDSVRVLDFSVSGQHARPPRNDNDPGWEAPQGKGMAIGRYNEARLCYTTPQFSSPAGPRTIHLGMDLFAPSGTAVHAPLAGRVVSAFDNALPGDYGPTVILEHAPSGAPPFYTLYGHLARESLSDLEPGVWLDRGEAFVRLGGPEENGGWPPHLHFQVITDLMGQRNNFPGVAAPKERDVWLEICPDPNMILNIPEAAFPAAAMPPAEILSARARFLNPSLSVSYRRPLTIVRGYMQFLYDHEGHVFLDGVNNVPHVGHCHPRVVEAVSRQAAILNTNTRYLHPLLVTYAQRLAATLPDPLEVCFFCNSGSEANDLALRLARLATGRSDMLVLDAAYHGNLAGLIAISPYKFNGAGGSGRPAGTHVFPLPDPYRGNLHGDPDCGARYAAELAEVLKELENQGTPIAAFLAESLPGCGGQVVLPDGFLSRAFAAVRAGGGVAIADEVQVGFGRVGDAFWGFQSQDALPDIVTMGKPMGNGHPLAAVVTTRKIADAFRTGMEYFNTFGGNPVSCAAGLAVLDVIEEEGLQDHARRVGIRLKAGLETLKSRHALVGDVRGRGLYLGVELVRHRETLEPADREAAYVADRLRDLGILISVDGPLHNVLKIKPPLCFNEADAHRLVDTLDTVLSETFLQPA